MGMSSIFLLHAITFLFVLQPALHLADGRAEAGGATSSSISWAEGRNNNKTGVRRFEEDRFGNNNIVMTTSRGTSATKDANTLNHLHGRRHGAGGNPLLPPTATLLPTNYPSHFPKNIDTKSMDDLLQHQGDDPNLDGGLSEPILLPSSSRIIGPYFETNKTIFNIVARAGQNVLMDCAVVLLQGRTVSWLRRKKDNLQLLTVGNATYSSDSRVGLHFRYPNNWRLGITSVIKRDEGEYRCQLSTHPPKTLTFHLKVIAPAVLILDENGNAITERHYKEDSSLHLTCKASHLDQPMDKVAWYKGDRILPGGDSRIKVKLWKNSTNGEASAFLSVLSVRRGDSGNYTCRASPTASNTIAVHVLNGELPAAVQHENHSNILLPFMSFWVWSLLTLVSSATSTSLT